MAEHDDAAVDSPNPTAGPRTSKAVYRYEPVGDADSTTLTETVTTYFDGEADSYDDFDHRVVRRRLYLAAIDALVAAVIERDPLLHRVLSFGCGTGRREASLRALFPSRGLQIQGIDRSPQMRRLAEARGISTSPTLMDLSQGQEPAPFDLALCLYSFIHLPSAAVRRDTLRGLRQVLRPGGRLLIDVFNLNDRHEWKSKVADGCVGVPPARGGSRPGDVIYSRENGTRASYMHYFRLGEIASLIEDAGFDITSVVGVGHGYAPGMVGLPLDEGCLYIEATTSGLG